MTPPRRFRLLPAVLLGVALVLGGCAPAPMLQPPEAIEAAPQAVPGLESYYEQDLAWTECGDRHICTTVQVPMDYEDPQGQTVDLAVKVAEATGTSLGSLVINPGGPGGSGVEFLDHVDDLFSDELLAAYDVVGFDPRGVGESDSVHCLDSQELDDYFGSTYAVDTEEGWEEFIADETAYGQACLENTGELLNFVDTISAARDMDILRAVLGEPSLTYLGYSYGTFLGATYADLFPEHVNRFVLDGALDPALSYSETVSGQVEGFDTAYRSFIADCLAGPDCPFEGDVDAAMQETADLLVRLEAEPVPSADPERPATSVDLINAIVIALYNVQSWPALSEALATLIEDGDGSQVRFLSDLAMEREDDGTYPLDQGAFRAINCLDHPVQLDREQITAAAEELIEVSEVFGPYFGYGEVGCATMPTEPAAARGQITASGAPPMLVVGTTRDPATPHEWAEAMAEQLEAAVLVSYDGDGHTAYGAANTCVTGAVDGFLINGQLPDHGLQC